MKANDKEKKLNKHQKDIVEMIKFIISVFFIVLIGYVVLNYVPFIAKYDHYVIATNSMEPVINVGDVVIINTDVKGNELHEGQIIAFYADIRGDGIKQVVVHYLDLVTEVDGENIYRTKPEISDDLDPWTLKDGDIVGIHVLTIPKIGPFLLFAQSTVGRIVLVADIVVIYVVVSIAFPSKNKKKKISNETNIDSQQ